MASRDALLSLGMAGLADVLDSSSDEEKELSPAHPEGSEIGLKTHSGNKEGSQHAVAGISLVHNADSQEQTKTISSPKQEAPKPTLPPNSVHTDSQHNAQSPVRTTGSFRLRRAPTKLPLFDSDSDQEERHPPAAKLPPRKLSSQSPERHPITARASVAEHPGVLTTEAAQIEFPRLHSDVPELPSVAPALPAYNNSEAIGKDVCGIRPPATSLAAVPASVPYQAVSSFGRKEAAQQPLSSVQPELQSDASKVQMPPVAADAELLASVSIADPPMGLQQQNSSLQKLRSISTPTQQLRQKDEEIAVLQSTIKELQGRLADSEQQNAHRVSSAVESAKAALEQDMRTQATALSTAIAELDECKASADARERQHQKQLKEAQLAASLAADAASIQMTQLRDQCARDVQDAEARARARVSAEYAAQRVQLDAESAALREERAALNRDRQSAEALSTLTAQVEAVSCTAIQREKRLTSRLEDELMEREQRCQQREKALSQREASFSAVVQDTEVMRKQLCEISKKADAAFSECTSGTVDDRERLQREAASLNSAVHALQQLREDAAANMDVQRTLLQDSRETRDRERERFLQELTDERVRLAQERSAAWAEVDRAHAAVLESQRKISELEAHAATVLRDTARVRAEKEGLEAHIAHTREEHDRQTFEVVQQKAQLEKDRTLLVADAQSLHTSTYELCSLRDALAEEKDKLSTGLKHLQALRQQTSLEQAAAADAGEELHKLYLQISEKRAELSEQNLKVGRARKHWQALRAEVQAQVQQWTNRNQDLPDLHTIWDVIVVDQEGVEVRAVQGRCKRCAQAGSAAGAGLAAVDPKGKENTQREAVKALSHKLAAFASIINRRRSCTKEQKAVDKDAMVELAACHGQLGLHDTLAWGRQAHSVFPAQSGHTGSRVPCGSSMPFTAGSPNDGSHPWNRKMQLPNLKQTNRQLERFDVPLDTQQNRALPSGFVALQPLSTTEDSFSYHESKGSKPHCMISQHTNQESACSQETATIEDPADSPEVQASV